MMVEAEKSQGRHCPFLWMFFLGRPHGSLPPGRLRCRYPVLFLWAFSQQLCVFTVLRVFILSCSSRLNITLRIIGRGDVSGFFCVIVSAKARGLTCRGVPVNAGGVRIDWLVNPSGSGASTPTVRTSHLADLQASLSDLKSTDIEDHSQ